jgi:transposase
LALTLDQAIPADAEVRVVEAFVQRLDCSTLDAEVQSLVGHPGAPSYDPRLLLTVCLYGVIRGIFSFRELSAACERDLDFLWLCGGWTPSHHTLSTFYSEHGAFLDARLTDILAALRVQGLVTYTEVTLDGRKVPANANKDSMHRVATLTKHHQEAKERVARLRADRDVKGSDGSRREAAQRQAAADRLRRLEAALGTLKTRTKEREEGRSDPAETRVSETDPDARKMKMHDGGYRPAFNVQTVAETQSGLIVAVDVVDQASDNGLLASMMGQAETVTGVKVERALVDAGYSSAADVETLETAGTEVYMPIKNEKKEKAAGKDPYAPKRRDSAHVARWRQRMGLEASRAIYKRRAPVAEGVHAQQSNRGFKRFRLRGLTKARTESLWHALAHNFQILVARKWLTPGKVRPEAS